MSEEELIHSIADHLANPPNYEQKIMEVCGCGCSEQCSCYQKMIELVDIYGWTIKMKKTKSTTIDVKDIKFTITAEWYEYV